MNKEQKSQQQQPHQSSDQRLGCLASTKGGNQARSFDIRESLTGPADRPAVSKSFSFGGYPAPQHLEPRKQPGGGGGPSGVSGGARATPPAIVKGQVVWAVSDVSMVPAGSVLINPDNGTPYLNSDGSVYMFDPSNPPRLEVSQVVPQQQPVASYPPGTPQPPGLDTGLPLADQVAKISLDTDQMSVGSHSSSHSQPLMPPWPLPVQPRLQPSHPPYILVNPVSNLPIPHYIPYLSQPPAPQPPPPPQPPSRPLLFSMHRSGAHGGALVLYLQHCPSLLTRAQLTSFLDSFLGPASPQYHGGQWQFLDAAGVWCDLVSLPDNTAVTNRFPVQIYFDTEDQAGQTVAALRQVGFLQLDPGLDQLQQQ